MRWPSAQPSRGPNFIDVPQLPASPKRPRNGFTRLFAKLSDGSVYGLEPDGTESDLAATGSGSFVGAKAYNSTTQSINGTAALTFDSEEWDTDAFHSTVSNTSRMTVPTGKGGKYLMICSAKEASGGMTDSYFQKNGTTRLRSNTPYVGSGGGGTPYGISIEDLAQGDYVEFFIVTGGATNFGSATSPSEDQAIFTFIKVG